MKNFLFLLINFNSFNKNLIIIIVIIIIVNYKIPLEKPHIQKPILIDFHSLSNLWVKYYS